jgi:hypothetical protein
MTASYAMLLATQSNPEACTSISKETSPRLDAEPSLPEPVGNDHKLYQSGEEMTITFGEARSRTSL